VSKSVKVVLAIEVEVDEGYSGAQHGEDIVLTTRKTFPVAKVTLLMMEVGRESIMLKPA
jgi:hypothetical protein